MWLGLVFHFVGWIPTTAPLQIGLSNECVTISKRLHILCPVINYLCQITSSCNGRSWSLGSEVEQSAAETLSGSNNESLLVFSWERKSLSLRSQKKRRTSLVSLLGLVSCRSLLTKPWFSGMIVSVHVSKPEANTLSMCCMELSTVMMYWFRAPRITSQSLLPISRSLH